MKGCGHFNSWDRYGRILTLWLAFHEGLLLPLLPIFHILLHFLLLSVAFMKSSQCFGHHHVAEMDKAIISASSCEFKILDPLANWILVSLLLLYMCFKLLFEPISSVVFESVSKALFFMVFSKTTLKERSKLSFFFF